MKRRIAIVASHPIQYHAHWYRDLARSPELDIEVIYCHRPAPSEQAESGFGVDFSWDIPLLDGYRYRFLKNTSLTPGVSSFQGTKSPELRSIVIHERYDAVVVSGWHTQSYWQAIRACWACDTPVLVRSDSHLREERSAFRRALKWLPWRYFIGRMDGCLAAGQWSREYFLHYGARPECVFIVPHCAERLAAHDADSLHTLRAEGRQRWGLNPIETTFLFAGKFIARKRIGDLIRALATAAAAGSPVHGLLAGDGPLLPEMQALAKELSAPVTFAGFLNQSQMPAAYAASDILVLPSDFDTWGLVVDEAMAYGRACLVSDRVGCGPDLIEQGRTGFTFPCTDAQALSRHMRLIADSPGMAAQMGEAALIKIASHSAQAATSALIQALAAIMEIR